MMDHASIDRVGGHRVPSPTIIIVVVHLGDLPHQKICPLFSSKTNLISSKIII